MARDLSFAQIVVDGFDQKHILIDGEIVSIHGPKANEWVEEIVVALRSGPPARTGGAIMAASARVGTASTS